MKKNTLIFILFITFNLSVLAQPGADNLNLSKSVKPITKDNIFKTPGYFNWGMSIIKGDDGKYHLFYSRWKEKYSFYGWLTHSEIAHAISDSPAGPWKYKETAIKCRGKYKWNAITAHNPKIKYFNGKYYLYYISTHMGGKKYTESDLIETSKVGYSHPKWKILRPNMRTGVAVSKSLNGPWKSLKKPLIEPSGPITTLTVNPAVAKGSDNKYYMIIKGDKPNEKRFIRNQAIAVSDYPDKGFVIQPKPVIDYLDTEDVSMWFDKKRNRFYAIFHAHTFIGLITSTDGINWNKAKNYKIMGKIVHVEGGEDIKPDRFERPFVFYENGEASVIALTVKKGKESYSVYFKLNN